MGNKSKILPDIFNAASIAPDKCTIFDAFSGTTNVGQYFKTKGYKIISNDINTTSKLLGEVYLKLNSLPSFDSLFNFNCNAIARLNALKATSDFIEKKKHFLNLNHNTNDENYLLSVFDTNAYNLLVYLSFYANRDDYEDPAYNYSLQIPDFIWRNFCANGYKSKYFNLVSQKSLQTQINSLQRYLTKNGSNQIISTAIQLLEDTFHAPFNIKNIEKCIDLLKDNINLLDNNAPLKKVIVKLQALNKRKNHIGNRMFFSEDHGHRIDTINNLSLLWLKDNIITYEEYCFVQCSLVEATALFSNTSATYQAFYKTYRANTLQEFRLVFPEIIASEHEHSVYCEDTFELINTLPEVYDLLYLDPPYNWRIYDSNYHLLNLLSDYANLADTIIDYEIGIAGAAGENRQLERNYTNYNRRNTFETLLFQLIKAANCRYIVISYSDSLSNHNKNSLSSVEKIEAFLQDNSLFVPESYKKIEVSSVNFESRKSEKKEDIHELLFVAEKRNS